MLGGACACPDPGEETQERLSALCPGQAWGSTHSGGLSLAPLGWSSCLVLGDPLGLLLSTGRESLGILAGASSTAPARGVCGGLAWLPLHPHMQTEKETGHGARPVLSVGGSDTPRIPQHGGA